MTPQTYKVRRGDNLSIIAKNFSVDVNELAKENNITLESHIKPEQELKLPEKKIRVKVDAVPDKADENVILKWIKDNFLAETSLDNAIAIGKRLVPDWSDEFLGQLRAIAANERVQQTNKVAIKGTDKPASYQVKPHKKQNSKTTNNIEVVKKYFKDTYSEPSQHKLNGVQLTKNEKRKIMASVAMCEMSGDGFGSINADQEFNGRLFERKGIETGYSRIVHIGLSYGLIQFTQDGDALGNVLTKMHAKDQSKFIEVFGGGDPDIANSLIMLTTEGHPDVKGKPDAHISGQKYWSSIKKTSVGKKIKELSLKDANKDGKSDLPIAKEIRGIHVQPLVPNKGEPAIDIWTGVWKDRFLAAGKVAVFQEAQLDAAIEGYLDTALPLAKKLKVRSALALAFLVASKVRGADMEILKSVAGKKGTVTPFESGDKERECIEAIAKATVVGKDAKVLGYIFDKDEARRAEKLMKDELGFLAEDFYDLATYT